MSICKDGCGMWGSCRVGSQHSHVQSLCSHLGLLTLTRARGSCISSRASCSWRCNMASSPACVTCSGSSTQRQLYLQ